MALDVGDFSAMTLEAQTTRAKRSHGATPIPGEGVCASEAAINSGKAACGWETRLTHHLPDAV